MIAIDVYFLLNFCFNMLLMQMIVYLRKCRRHVKRIAAGAAIGAGWSVAALVGDWIPYPVCLLMHWLICPGLMCKVSCCLKGRRELIVTLVCFYFTVFAMGGAMNAVYGMTKETHSFVILVLSMAMIQLIIIVLLKVIKQDEDNKTLFCKVELEFRGKKTDMTGIWDTGNRLCSLTKRPVHLMDCIGMRMLLEQDELEQVIKWQHEMEEGDTKECFIAGKMLHRIPFCGIGESDGWLLAFEIDHMMLYRRGKEIQIARPLIGISKTMFCEGKQYRIIINTQGI